MKGARPKVISLLSSFDIALHAGHRHAQVNAETENRPAQETEKHRQGSVLEVRELQLEEDDDEREKGEGQSPPSAGTRFSIRENCSLDWRWEEVCSGENSKSSSCDSREARE